MQSGLVKKANIDEESAKCIEETWENIRLEVQIHEDENKVTEVRQSNESKLSLIEKKKKDLEIFEEIIKRYANNNQAVLMMEETMRRILENKTSQTKESRLS